MLNEGAVTRSRVSNAEWGSSANSCCSPGSAGLIVAFAITVSVAAINSATARPSRQTAISVVLDRLSIHVSLAVIIVTRDATTSSRLEVKDESDGHW